uniref:Core protein VP4 n=1 Tax=Mudumu virus TaxID=2841875 RepID=A0A8E8R9N3_9REOV|nr:capping enzyme [Mudumu virus]
MSHAVIFLSSSLKSLVQDLYLNTIEITASTKINELWLQNGKHMTDVYAIGALRNFTLRQLRGHGFIFIRYNQDKIHTKNGDAPKDIVISTSQLKLTEPHAAKKLESIIGEGRIRLRREFGNILRRYALTVAEELHGSEIETLMQSNPRRHKIYGLPMMPPRIENGRIRDDILLEGDVSTDEKLVSMLDYVTVSADVVYYVGCGDLRTLQKFSKRDKLRFQRVKWVCIDPIVKHTEYKNVESLALTINSAEDLRKLKRPGFEHMLLWDVRTERTNQTDEEWEEDCLIQDTLGEMIAMANKDWLHMAVIKRRIPIKKDKIRLFSSYLIPQPGADSNLYELRNIMILDGKSWIQRDHIPKATATVVDSGDMRRLVERFQGAQKGRILKKRIIEGLHITRRNGLLHRSNLTRADLFYLTNRMNMDLRCSINNVVETSFISTLWVGDAKFTGYDDFPYDRRYCMLHFSSENLLVLDGNGFILWLMWHHDEGIQNQPYDPWWAEQFAVISRRTNFPDHLPDVSLCRFIGLRTESSLLRLRSEIVHKRVDLVKSLGLDVSGHLYVALLSGRYCVDLLWWIKMITQWSNLEGKDKVKQLKETHAEVIEWKEEKVDEAWHLVEDLIAALQHASLLLRDICSDDFERWIEVLRSIRAVNWK